VNYDKSDVGKGLYPKYTVIRNDGRDKPGEMHEGCEYFVIDLTHDPLAVAPLEAYAEKASEAGYHDLARDLRLKAMKSNCGTLSDLAKNMNDNNPFG